VKYKRSLIFAASVLAGGFGVNAHAGDAKEIAATVCAACHGEDGNSVAPTFPKLAGQNAVYLQKQLKDFLSGKRKNEAMDPFLNSFGDGDTAALGVHFAREKTSPGTVEDAALAEAGKKLYLDGNTDSGIPACAGCHQEDGLGNDRYPRLAAQHQAYTIAQMEGFKSGARNNDKGKIMRSVAQRMTEAEMKAVSEYLAGMEIK
jgi:cytochrome c553